MFASVLFFFFISFAKGLKLGTMTPHRIVHSELVFHCFDGPEIKKFRFKDVDHVNYRAVAASRPVTYINYICFLVISFVCCAISATRCSEKRSSCALVNGHTHHRVHQPNQVLMFLILKTVNLEKQRRPLLTV